MVVCILMDCILVGYDKYRLDSIMLLANQMISKIRDGSEAHKGLRTGHVTYRLDRPMIYYAMDRATPIPSRGIRGKAETGKRR